MPKQKLFTEDHFIEYIKTGITVHDATGAIIMANHSACTLLGLTHDQLLGKTMIDDQWQTTHEDGSTFDSSDYPVMQCIRTSQPQKNILMGVKTPAGQQNWLKVTANPRFDDAGQLLRVYVSFVDVTEEVEVRHSLEQHQAFVEQMIEFLPVAVVLADYKLNIKVMNRHFYELTGYDSEQIETLEDAYRLMMPDAEYRKKIKQSFNKTVTSIIKNQITSAELEVKLTAIDGRELSVMVHLMNHHDAYIIATLEDHTAIKAIADARAKTNQLFREMFEQHSAVMLLIDPDNDGKIIDANEAAVKKYGYSRKELLEMSVYELNTLPRDQVKKIARAVLEEKIKEIEFQHRLKNRSVIDVHVYSKPITVNEQTLLMSVVFDITDRVRAQKTINEQFEHIQQQKNELNALFDSSLAGILYVDENRKILRVNNCLSEMFDYQPQELIGKHARVLHVNEEHSVEIGQKYDELLKQNRRVALEFQFKKKNNEVFWCLLSGLAINTENHTRGVVWVIVDISKQKESEHTALQALELAQQANTAKSRFLANMSHEIKTPLNVINGFSELLVNDPTSSDLQHNVQMIHSSANQLLKIIDEILDISKAETGSLRVTYSELNLKKLVSEVEETARNQCKRKGLLFETSYNSLPEYLYSDNHRIKQVLNNLLANAVKFTDKGKINFDITTAYTEENQAVITFSVTDTGSGIATDYQPNIFDPFSQFDQSSARKHGGTGLGLALSKQIADLLNADLKLVHSDNNGSKFEFTLNATILSRKQPLTPTRSIAAANVATKVMAIDDYSLNLELLKKILKPYNIEAVTTSESKKAIDLIASHKPDLILIDLFMPDINGWQLAEKIRSLSGMAKTPLIAFSAQRREEVLNGGYDLEAFDDFIEKPVDSRKMLSLLEKHGFSVSMPDSQSQPDIKKLVQSCKTDLSEESTADFAKLMQKISQTGSFDYWREFGQLLLNKSPQNNNCNRLGQYIIDSADRFRVDELQKVQLVIEPHINKER